MTQFKIVTFKIKNIKHFWKWIYIFVISDIHFVIETLKSVVNHPTMISQKLRLKMIYILCVSDNIICIIQCKFYYKNKSFVYRYWRYFVDNVKILILMDHEVNQ